MTVKDVGELILAHCMGSCDNVLQFIDQLIEDGELDEDFFYKNEGAILHYVDDAMFSCEQCGWNFPIGEMGASEEILICRDCEEYA